MFQSVHRKKKEKSQKSKPRSGSTELRACADAKKSESKVSACETFVSGGWSDVSHFFSSIIWPRTKSTISNTASTSVIKGGGTKTKARLSASMRRPPSNATVKKIIGSRTKRTSA